MLNMRVPNCFLGYSVEFNRPWNSNVECLRWRKNYWKKSYL